MSEKWDRFYLDLAKFVANELSKDPSTKCGAVLVNSKFNKEFIGYNGFPRGVKDLSERYNNRELKYKMIVHAEVNAILKAGDFANGSTLYVWPSFAIPNICCECVKLAIQKGVKEIVGYPVDPKNKGVALRSSRWEESISASRQMCDEAGIKYRVVTEIPKHINDIKKFVTAIAHGDEEHRKWLQEAAEAFINNQPLPPSRHNTGIDDREMQIEGHKI